MEDLSNLPKMPSNGHFCSISSAFEADFRVEKFKKNKKKMVDIKILNFILYIFSGEELSLPNLSDNTEDAILVGIDFVISYLDRNGRMTKKNMK